MDIITGNEYDLRQLIKGAYERLEQSKDKFERYALIDYLYQLHELERAVTGRKSFVNGNRVFKSNTQFRKYTQYIDSLFERIEDEFIRFKDYHLDHFGAMLNISDEELDTYTGIDFVDDYAVIDKEEFCQYFYEFLSEYNLESFFDKFISGRKIFNRPVSKKEKYFGTLLHDVRKKRSSIVLCDFEYTIPYLLTLSHEFGHAFDLSMLSKKEFDTYMKYSYSSVFGETISMVFERLFYDFLFKKKYRIDDVKEIYSEFLFENSNYILDSYIMSLLDDETLRQLGLGTISNAEIVKKVGNDFTRPEELIYHLEGRKLDTWNTTLYSYGDFFSAILKDRIQKEGFDCKLMRDFLSMRTEALEPDDLEYRGFNMETYRKVYKKDVSRLKK